MSFEVARRHRFMRDRAMWVAVVYLSFETLLRAVMLGCGWRAASGGGIRSPYFAGIHYDLVQGTLIMSFREARRVLALRIRTDGPHPPRVPEGPVLVMCRYAGPGDSFILMYALLHSTSPRTAARRRSPGCAWSASSGWRSGPRR